MPVKQSLIFWNRTFYRLFIGFRIESYPEVAQSSPPDVTEISCRKFCVSIFSIFVIGLCLDNLFFLVQIIVIIFGK